MDFNYTKEWLMASGMLFKWEHLVIYYTDVLLPTEILLPLHLCACPFINKTADDMHYLNFQPKFSSRGTQKHLQLLN